ncbi:winged helix-turn-helix domain-containing protein [Bradyrhizobium sp. 2TAF24]|uniref:winged helix-turn-helix domain-containing protein n=1 Tax=Bradyrhizobium sp. 2TAF24 TaxID=3233011 RepID=UPI003F8FD16D
MTLAAKPVVLLAGENSFIGLLKYIVEQEGFHGVLADNMTDVISLAEVRRPQLIALDDLPPHGSALAVREKIYSSARTGHIPVMVLLADTTSTDDLDTRHLERTDYLLKPFSPNDFIVRMHSLLRPTLENRANVLSFADIVVELDAHRVYRNKSSVHLSRVEFQLLKHLVGSPRKVFSREELLIAVWGRNIHIIPRTIDVHMSRIRRALSPCGEPSCIRTVRGIGYSLDSEPDTPPAPQQPADQ